MSPLFRTLLIGLGALIALNSTHAELYSWKDKDGKTIFSDRPPLDAKQEVREEGASPKSGKTNTDDPRAALAREEARKKKIKENDKKQIKWRCAELEKQYQTLLQEQKKLESVDPKKAAILQTDAENHKDTLEKMCN